MELAKIENVKEEKEKNDKEIEEASEPAVVGHVYKSADEALAATSQRMAEKQFDILEKSG